MDRIWSPWRHAYVTRSEESPGCVFCIARTIGEGRQLIVHEGAEVGHPDHLALDVVAGLVPREEVFPDIGRKLLQPQ